MCLITIGLTCFNAEKTIKAALMSALSQNFNNFEIIVIDDCSSDNSWEIIQSIAARDKRIKIKRNKKNGGPSFSRNAIINMALGQYIAFFDDDDESLPQRIFSQYQKIKFYENNYGIEHVACYCSGIRKYPNGYKYKLIGIGSKPIIPSGEALIDYLLFNKRSRGVCYGAGTPTCSLMIRTQSLKDINGFDENLRRVEDIDLAIRLAQIGAFFVGVTDSLFIQNVSEGGEKSPLKNLESELQLINKFQVYLKKKGRYDYANKWFLIRYLHFSDQKIRFLTNLTIFLIKYPIAGIFHLIRSGPKRFGHERRMKGIL